MRAAETIDAERLKPAVRAFAGHFRRFLRDERGATAIEYAMVASGVGVAVSATVWSLGTSVRETLYDRLATLMQ